MWRSGLCRLPQSAGRPLCGGGPGLSPRPSGGRPLSEKSLQAVAVRNITVVGKYFEAGNISDVTGSVSPAGPAARAITVISSVPARDKLCPTLSTTLTGQGPLLVSPQVPGSQCRTHALKTHLKPPKAPYIGAFIAFKTP